jgi:hypothetical protein
MISSEKISDSIAQVRQKSICDEEKEGEIIVMRDNLTASILHDKSELSANSQLTYVTRLID